MRKMNAAHSKATRDDDPDDDLADVDAEDPEDGKTLKPTEALLVKNFIRMWPRAIFHTSVNDGRKGSIAHWIPELAESGVYVLYRDDVPFYVGQAQKLRTRLRKHANSVMSSKTYFWNYFSAFIVKDKSHIKEVEAILISAMPSVVSNSSKPVLKKVPMDDPTKHLVRELRKNGQY
jgi:hypothetical protein